MIGARTLPWEIRSRKPLRPMTSRRKRHLSGVLVCGAVVAVEIRECREEVRHG